MRSKDINISSIPYILDSYAEITKTPPVWDHSDGEPGEPGYEEQWDARTASYVVQLQEDGTWSGAFFVAGPDHGIIHEGEVVKSARSMDAAKVRCHKHAAMEDGISLYYEDQMMASFYYDTEDEVPREELEGEYI